MKASLHAFSFTFVVALTVFGCATGSAKKDPNNNNSIGADVATIDTSLITWNPKDALQWDASKNKMTIKLYGDLATADKTKFHVVFTITSRLPDSAPFQAGSSPAWDNIRNEVIFPIRGTWGALKNNPTREFVSNTSPRTTDVCYAPSPEVVVNSSSKVNSDGSLLVTFDTKPSNEKIGVFYTNQTTEAPTIKCQGFSSEGKIYLIIDSKYVEVKFAYKNGDSVVEFTPS